MRIFVAAVAAALLLPPASPAQTTIPVDEREYLAPFGEAAHPAVLGLARELAEARAAGVAARTLDNPELGLLREAPSGGADLLELTVAWQLPDPGRRRLAIAAADAGELSTAARLDAELLALELELREVYTRWAVAASRVTGLGAQAERLAALAERERHRAEAGEASGLDARRLELAAAESRAELARAQAEAAGAEAAARAWRPDLPTGARPALPPLPPAAAPPTVSTRPHPLVAALEAELAAARREAELSRRVLAMPAVVAGWQREDQAGGAVDGPIVGLSWPLPIFDRNQSERLVAGARARALESRLTLLRDRLAAERQGRLAVYERLHRAALDAAVAADLGSPTVAAAEAAFRLGEASVTDLLETVRSATAATLTSLELREAALAARRELARVDPPPPADRLLRPPPSPAPPAGRMTLDTVSGDDIP